MKRLRKHSIREDDRDEYATTEDFRKIFTDNMDSLYLLSLLLTNDQQKAQQRFVAGLEDSLASSKVFRHWARVWARHAIIQDAIRVLQPRPDDASSSAAASEFPADYKRPSVADPHFDAVLALRDFDRFVFVMSVLEGYPDRCCALLLGCSVPDIHGARAKAFKQIARLLYTPRSKESGRDLQEVKR